MKQKAKNFINTKIKNNIKPVFYIILMAVIIVLVFDILNVNLKDYDIINPKETINNIFSVQDITTQFTNNDNIYYFDDENGYVKSFCFHLPDGIDDSNEYQVYKYKVDNSLGNKIVIKDVTVTGKKDTSTLNQFNKMILLKKNKKERRYIITGSRKNIERILKQWKNKKI